jgi:hypothetical protein
MKMSPLSYDYLRTLKSIPYEKLRIGEEITILRHSTPSFEIFYSSMGIGTIVGKSLLVNKLSCLEVYLTKSYMVYRRGRRGGLEYDTTSNQTLMLPRNSMTGLDRNDLSIVRYVL